MERIPVTHAGSLIRPPELLSFLAAKGRGQSYDENAYAVALRDAVRDVVSTILPPSRDRQAFPGAYAALDALDKAGGPDGESWEDYRKWAELRVRAGYYAMEQANPRHEHEWRIWEDVTLPEGTRRAAAVRAGRRRTDRVA
jgi:hypothetical protein